MRHAKIPFSIAAATLALISLSTAVPASETPLELISDRPDQTESSAVIPRGMAQLELGWTHAERDGGGVESESDSLPETLLRIGLSRSVELRLGFGGRLSDELRLPSGDRTKTDGAADTSLGFKVKLAEEGEGGRPEIALLGTFSLPTGDDDLTSDRVDPSFRLAFSHTLSERLGIGYNIGSAWSSAEDGGGERDTLAVVEWTVALGIAATDRLGFFVELFGESGLSAHGAPANSFDGGATWLVTPELQLDLFAGAGLSDAADDWFAGLGLVYRFGTMRLRD
jgi:hypothetical protein